MRRVAERVRADGVQQRAVQLRDAILALVVRAGPPPVVLERERAQLAHGEEHVVQRRRQPLAVRRQVLRDVQRVPAPIAAASPPEPAPASAGPARSAGSSRVVIVAVVVVVARQAAIAAFRALNFSQLFPALRGGALQVLVHHEAAEHRPAASLEALLSALAEERAAPVLHLEVDGLDQLGLARRLGSLDAPLLAPPLAALQTPASRLALLLVQAGGVGVERGVVRVRVVVGSGRRVVVRRLRLRRGHRRGLRSERLQRHEQLGERVPERDVPPGVVHAPARHVLRLDARQVHGDAHQRVRVARRHHAEHFGEERAQQVLGLDQRPGEGGVLRELPRLQAGRREHGRRDHRGQHHVLRRVEHLLHVATGHERVRQVVALGVRQMVAPAQIANDGVPRAREVLLLGVRRLGQKVHGVGARGHRGALGVRQLVRQLQHELGRARRPGARVLAAALAAARPEVQQARPDERVVRAARAVRALRPAGAAAGVVAARAADHLRPGPVAVEQLLAEQAGHRGERP